MRKLFSVFAVLCAASLAACGGDSGPEGKWVLDAKGSFEASRGGLKAQIPPGAPAELAQQMEAEVRKTFDAMTVNVTLKGDKTFTSKAIMRDLTEDATGTWSVSGSQVTLQTKTKDGKPAEGDNAKSMTLTWKGDTMSGKPDANSPLMLVLKRG